MARKTAPLSVRLSSELDALVRAEARRTNRSRGAVLEALASEAARARLFPGIVFAGPDSDRRAMLVGSGFDVWQVVQVRRELGSTEAMTEAFSLNERQVRLALAYYERFPEEIDEAIARNSRSLDDLLREYPFAEVSHLAAE